MVISCVGIINVLLKSEGVASLSLLPFLSAIPALFVLFNWVFWIFIDYWVKVEIAVIGLVSSKINLLCLFVRLFDELILC